MYQLELSEFINTPNLSIKQRIISLRKEGKTESQIQKDFGFSEGKYYRLKKKLNLLKKSQIRAEQTNQINKRINLRKQGLSICEIAQLENVSDQAIYLSLQKYAPELLSDKFLTSVRQHIDLIRHRTKNIAPIISIDDLPQLIEFRKQGYSVGALVTYPQRPIKSKLWYVLIQRKGEGKTIGRVSREFLLKYYSKSEISQKERKKTPYLSLNKFLDKLIEEKEN